MPEKILGIGRWASLGNCYSVYSSWVREISIFPVSLSLLVGRGQNKPRISWLWKQSLHIVAFLDSSYSLHPLEAFQLLLLPTGAPETTHASHTNDCGNEIAIEYLLYSFRSTTGIYYFTTSVVSFLYFLFLLLNKGHFAFDPKKKKKKLLLTILLSCIYKKHTNNMIYGLLTSSYELTFQIIVLEIDKHVDYYARVWHRKTKTTVMLPLRKYTRAIWKGILFIIFLFSRKSLE